MKKICKKIILTKSIEDFNNLNYSMDFYMFNYKDLSLKSVENPLLKVSKKGYIPYILPGSFGLPVKHYFPQHTYIQYGEIHPDPTLIMSLITNKNIMLFKYNNAVFLNDSNVFRSIKNSEHVEPMGTTTHYTSQFLVCLSFLV